MTFLTFLITALLGSLAWTLTEYLVHRFDGHGFRRLIPSHLLHHQDPLNYEVIHTPKSTLLLVIAIWTGLGALAGGWLHALIFGTAFVLAYRYYEWLHDTLHESEPSNWYGRWARRHHFFHHFHDPRMNHGVTTSLWDVVFGTYHPVSEPIRVPRKLAMPWLLDSSGAPRSSHRKSYCVS